MSFKARLLIVDDDPEVLDMLRELLTHGEYEVVCAVNGREALQKATEIQSGCYSLRRDHARNEWF